MVYKKFGFRTFFIFFFKRRKSILFFVGCLVGCFVSLFIFGFPPLALLLGGIGFMCFFILFFLGLLEYSNYSITTSDTDLQVKRGIFSTQEVGIPNNNIGGVDVRQSTLERILFLCTVTVIKEEQSKVDEMIVLKYIPIKIGQALQKEILKLSQVDHVKAV